MRRSQHMSDISKARRSGTAHHEVQTEPGRVDLIDPALLDELFQAAVLRFEGGDVDDLWKEIAL